MAKMIDQKLPTNKGEQVVWDFLKNLLSDDIIVYHNREVKGREFDFCLLLPDQGILILEVKGWEAKGIRVKDPDQIIIPGYGTEGSPKKQANMYKFSMIEKVKNSFGKSPLVLSMVVYPFIDYEGFYDAGLNVVSEVEYTLLKEDLLEKQRLINKINALFTLNHHIKYAPFNDNLLFNVRSLFETNITRDISKSDHFHYSDLMITKNVLSETKCQSFMDAYCHGEKKIVFTNNIETFDQLINSFDHVLRDLNIARKGLNLDLGYIDLNKENKGTIRHFSAFNFELMLVDDQLEEDEKHFYDGNVGDHLSMLKSLSKSGNFNIEQYLLEHADDSKNILVRAGAGTGKTYSMVSRIAFLCNKPNFPITNFSDEIAMVTFTNKAADQMKTRIKQMFTNYFILTGDVKYLQFIDDVDRSKISTIHKFALNILREASYYTKLGSDFRISDNQYLRNQLYDKYLNEFFLEKSSEIDNFSLKVKVTSYNLKKSLMQLADRLLTKNIDLEQIQIDELGEPKIKTIPFINELFMKVIVKAETEYSIENKERNALSLNECIISLMRIMPNNISAIRKLSIRYLFIDEFQDTDDVQIAFFQQFQQYIKTDLKFFVVGDLKQSIYRFRGAKLSAFDQLKQNKTDWLDFYLTINYRSDRRLLEDFDQVFKRMGREELLPYEDGDRIKGIKTFNSLEHHLLKKYSIFTSDYNSFYDELFKVISEERKNIVENKDQIGINNATIAILVRTNREVEAIIKEGRIRGISVETDDSGHLFQFDATIDLFRLVNALVRGNDPVALTNFIESNYTNLHLNYERLHNLDYGDTREELLHIVNQYLLTSLGQTWNDILAKINTQPVLNVLRELFNSLKPWKNYSNSITRQKNYIANYEYLIERMIHYCRVDAITLIRIQQYLQVNITTRQSEKERSIKTEDDQNKLICMTVHKAKGLEFTTVILPFTDRSLRNKRQMKIEANYSHHKLAYYLSIKRNKEEPLIECNNYFQEDIEFQEQAEEESRILYVALTRAIYKCIWIDSGENKKMTWATLLEGEV